MLPTLRTLVVLLLALLLPLRAVAAVTMGLCAMGQQEAPAAHQGCDEQPAKSAPSTCNLCVEHCSSAVFALCAPQSATGNAVTESSLPLAERVAPAFVPDQLDRPPLASLR